MVKPVAIVHNESECRISLDVVSFLTNPPSTTVPVKGNLLRSHSERLQTLPEDMRVVKACEKDFSWTIFYDNPCYG